MSTTTHCNTLILIQHNASLRMMATSLRMMAYVRFGSHPLLGFSVLTLANLPSWSRELYISIEGENSHINVNRDNIG